MTTHAPCRWLSLQWAYPLWLYLLGGHQREEHPRQPAHLCLRGDLVQRLPVPAGERVVLVVSEGYTVLLTYLLTY